MTKLPWFVIVVLLFLQCMVTETQQASTSHTTTVSTSTSLPNFPGKMGRAIPSSAKGYNDVNKENNNDDAFDNTPEVQDSSEIHFPSDIPSPTQNISRAEVTPNLWKKIPLRRLVEFGSQVDVSALIKKYVGNVKVVTDNGTKEEFLADRNGAPIYNTQNEKSLVLGGTLTRTSLEAPTLRGGSTHRDRGRHGGDLAPKGFKAKPSMSAVCSPENKTVPVPITVEPHILIIPRCVRVERCGGCCLSDIMVCEPDTKDTMDFPIKKLAYVGDEGPYSRPLEFVDDQIVKIERHTSCRCKCRTKPNDCSPVHTYVENECSCVCKNQNDYAKCLTDSIKIWDKDSCMCTCKEIRDCSSGYYYDLNTCACEPEPEPRTRSLKASKPGRG